jgi:peptide/nickel transport system permease protein
MDKSLAVAERPLAFPASAAVKPRRFSPPAIGLAGFVGAAILVIFVLGTLIIPLIWSGDPTAMSMFLLQPPSLAHPMGTDDLGRDVFLQFVQGVRVSLTVGVAAALTTSLIGVLVGASAGFAGGLGDLIVMRVTEMFQVTPTFVLAAVIVAMWGPGLATIIMVIAILAWPQVALVVRGEVLRIKKLDFIDGARCLGYGETYILLCEVIPNALRPVLALATLTVGQAILIEASLSFLGLGDPSLISWGKMLSTGQGYLVQAWWLSVFPGLAIFLTVLACNLLGDGLGGYLNPKDKGR